MIATFFPSAHCRGTMAASKPSIPLVMRPEQVGRRLRLIREGFGLKPSQIADMIGIERTYWTRFEKGHRPPSEELCYLLNDRFGITLDFLLLGKWDKLPLDVAEKLRAAESNSTD